MAYPSADDAAGAWAWAMRQQPLAAQYEYASGIVPTAGGFEYSEPRTSHRASEFKVPLPANMTAFVHNHSTAGAGKSDEHFSRNDILVAKLLKRPSYVAAPSGAVFRYDPSTSKIEEVLSLIDQNQLPKRLPDPRERIAELMTK